MDPIHYVALIVITVLFGVIEYYSLKPTLRDYADDITDYVLRQTVDPYITDPKTRDDPGDMFKPFEEPNDESEDDVDLDLDDVEDVVDDLFEALEQDLENEER